MKHKSNKKINLVLAIALALVVVVVAGFAILSSSKSKNEKGKNHQNRQSDLADSSQSENTGNTAVQSGSSDIPAAQSLSLPKEMRAMWISFLEWEKADLSTEQGMRNTVTKMFDNCKDIGLNTVIVAVRPFSDAMYKSSYYPWSHLLTGTQGKDPGYDPLEVMVQEAHSRGLRIEAWLNPYRIKSTSSGPKEISQESPAAKNPDWVREINGMWFDPGIPEVRQLIADGVTEIVQNYDVDGIHFDDYFYPEFSPEQKQERKDIDFDEKTHDKYGAGDSLSSWRRNNVNEMVRKVYSAVKSANPNMAFGISPQGNNENNYQMQYSDLKLWMLKPGYVDYVMPQLYWGFNYLTQSGRDTYAFGNISSEWAGYDRIPEVKLYAGLGAYRIGVGDGGAGDQEEWDSGHNIADMVAALNKIEGYNGFALFRYEFMFENENPLGEQETEALKKLLAAEQQTSASEQEEGA